jgi:hypothetical protein
MSSSPEVPKKKVYRAPSLKTYGSLTEMTASSGNMGQDDNVKKAKFHKTG